MIKLHSLFFTQYPEGFYNMEVRSYFWLTLQWLTISLNSSLNFLQTWSAGHLPKSQTHLVALSLAFTHYPDFPSTADLLFMFDFSTLKQWTLLNSECPTLRPSHGCASCQSGLISNAMLSGRAFLTQLTIVMQPALQQATAFASVACLRALITLWLCSFLFTSVSSDSLVRKQTPWQITLLNTWNPHGIINQLYSNIKSKS